MADEIHNGKDTADKQTGDQSSFDVSSEIQKLQEQAEKYKSDYLYLRAEFDNYRKNMIKDRADLIKYGAEKFIRDFLGVFDNFERALGTQVTAENFPVFKKGVEMTASELKSILARHGVMEVPSEGQSFDPAVHEALGSEPSESVPEGQIVKVFQKAYRLNEKLLRPAQVIVARKPE